MVPYVKFVRGSNSAFNALQSKDPDTLYFISEPDSETGVLYLGDKLIADTISTSIGTLNLSDLANVKIGQNLTNNDILVFQDGKWKNIPFSSIIEVNIFDGENNGLVPIATEDERDKFLKGDGTWADVITPANIGSFLSDTIIPATVEDFNTVSKIANQFQEIKAKVDQHDNFLSVNIGALETRVSTLETQLEWGRYI